VTAGRSREGLGLRSLLPILVLDIACPYLAYHYLRQRLPRISPSQALLLPGSFLSSTTSAASFEAGPSTSSGS
jgi:hypothetical protein